MRRIHRTLSITVAAVCLCTVPIASQSAPHKGASEKDSIAALYSAMMALRSLPERIADGTPLNAGAAKLGPSQKYVAQVNANAARDFDNAAKVIPGDRWILGQEIRMFATAGNLVGAANVLAHCQSDAWWCAVLSGYVANLRGRYAAADSDFTVALAAMPEEQQCMWNDISVLLDADGRARLNTMSCAARDSVAKRVWGLADPLYLSAGNERRAEHDTRWTYVTLEASRRAAFCINGATTNFGEIVTDTNTSSLISGLDVLSDVIVRLGVPLYWATLEGGGYGRSIFGEPGGAVPQADMPVGPDPMLRLRALMAEVDLRNGGLMAKLRSERGGLKCPASNAGQTPMYHSPSQQNDPPRYHFLPSSHAVSQPLAAAPDDWTLDDLRARELYHPVAPDTFTMLDYQLAYFQRGDSAYLVAATDIRGDPLLTQSPVLNAMLAVTSDPAIPPDLWTTAPDPVFRWGVMVPATQSVVGLEVLTAKAVGRARLTAGPHASPQQHLGVSDILLLSAPQDPMPATIDAAVPLVAGTTRVPRGGTVGLIWEVYGLNRGDSVTYAVSARRLDKPGTLSGIGRALGLGGSSTDSAFVRWQETASEVTDHVARGVNLNVSQLNEGSYELQLTVNVPGEEPVTATQQMRIVKP